jgi:23S rRNA pseudouridine2605 synthase
LELEVEGLTLMTSDHNFACQMLAADVSHEREYRVLVSRRVLQQQFDVWQGGVVLTDGYPSAPADLHLETIKGKDAWLRVVTRQGRKHQIRDTCLQLGLPALRIILARIDNLELRTMKSHQWRYLTTKEVEEFKQPVHRWNVI